MAPSVDEMTAQLRAWSTRPLRLPQWMVRPPKPGQSRIYGFNADRRAIIGEVVDRVASAENYANEGELELELSGAAHLEIARLERASGGEDAVELRHWRELIRGLPRMSESAKLRALSEIARRTAEDIAGNFDPRVYAFACRAVPRVLEGVMHPQALARHAMVGGRSGIESLVSIEGELGALRRVAEQGTFVLVPTHSSNLDSIAIGDALARSQVSPVVYGAGKNLFTNPIISFFMHNLGAYRIDRRVRTQIYKRTLKTYSSVLLERGYHSLFFPGGTRSRSGAIESHLKLGLAGTAIEAFARNCASGRPKPIYFVPVTINYALVLEAETLIADHLAEVGKARYIIEDDEFSRIDRWISFFNRLAHTEGACVLRIGRPLDCFGNAVDEQGRSLAPDGRVIDVYDYVRRDGRPVLDAARDASYTRLLGRRIAEHYRTLTVVHSTALVALALWCELVERTPGVDLFGRVRRRDELDVDLELFLDRLEQLRLRAVEAESSGDLYLAASLRHYDRNETLDNALATLAGYHRKPMARKHGSSLRIVEPSLILYYQNRLKPYAQGLLAGVYSPRVVREVQQ